MSEDGPDDPEDLQLGIRAFQKGQYEQAYKLLHKYAVDGVARAQMVIARLYYAGHGVAKDEDKYMYWLQKAAENGDKAAKSQFKRIQGGRSK